MSARLCRLLRDDVREQLGLGNQDLKGLATDWRKLLFIAEQWQKMGELEVLFCVDYTHNFENHEAENVAGVRSH